MGKYKDGIYQGDIADAFYGLLQVEIEISGGVISDVRLIRYPHDRRTSETINQQALPLLRQEVITSQDANVDLITGATQTSQAFIESLKSALTKAI